MVDFKSFNFNSNEIKKLKNDRISLNNRIFWENYEKVRVVGKGAFGTVVLYRRNDRNLVVMKEIDIHNLSASERLSSINEVKVLSILDHPNIVKFFNSYEWNGKLLIEMEYCGGGSLAEFLAQLNQPLKEFEILTIFSQIDSAITYIHDRNILHRDLKTANIFMTKNKIFKVGDFGICKVLLTKKIEASTVVGTPHYISPEMCEGKLYDKKTDIWALGCILYEMACLQKTFEGNNLPSLINKIVKGKYAPVKRNYSFGFQKLIAEMLQKDPELRPNAHEIQSEVSELLIKSRYNRYNQEIFSNEISTEAVLAAQFFNKSLKQPRSLLYEVNLKKNHISLSKIELMPQIRIKDLSKSSNHFLALTYDYHVYAWGCSSNGQLGLGKMTTCWINKPTSIDELLGKTVLKVVAGECFSIFLCKNGVVLSCGSYASGCLASEMEEDCVTPTIINKLLGYNICDIVCGPRHVIAITDDGQVFGWGFNKDGQLGILDETQVILLPKLVSFSENVVIKKVFTGMNATVFIDSKNGLWACGSNAFNKLGFEESFPLKKIHMTCIRTPQEIKVLNEKPASICIGINHTLILTQSGQVVMLGCNETKLTNRFFFKRSSNLYSIFKFSGNTITKVQCGSSFFLAQSFPNHIYFWGVREIENESTHFNYQLNNLKKTQFEDENKDLTDFENEIVQIGDNNLLLMEMVKKIGLDYPIILVHDPKVIIDNYRDLSILNKSSNEKRRDIIVKPQPIISLYSSPINLQFGETIELVNVFCFSDDKVFIILETTISSSQSSFSNQNCVEMKKNKRKDLKDQPTLPIVKEELTLKFNSTCSELIQETFDPKLVKLKKNDEMFNFWTMPFTSKEIKEFNKYKSLENMINKLKSKLAENNLKLNIYENQIQDLQEELAVVKKLKNKKSNHFKLCIFQ